MRVGMMGTPMRPSYGFLHTGIDPVSAAFESKDPGPFPNFGASGDPMAYQSQTGALPKAIDFGAAALARSNPMNYGGD